MNPQSRLDALGEKRVQLKKQLAAVRMEALRAVQESGGVGPVDLLGRPKNINNEAALLILRQLDGIKQAMFAQRLRRDNYPEYLRKKREHYARKKSAVLASQKRRYERDKPAILEKMRVKGKIKRAQVSADPKVIAQRKKRIQELGPSRAKRMREFCEKWWEGHVSVRTPERVREYNRRYYAKPGKAEERHKYQQGYRRSEEGRKKRRLREKAHREDNPHFKIRVALKSRLYGALKSKGIRKTIATMKLAGCSLEFLKQHLESQFLQGMSWDNYGEWHIDHKIPCKAFDLTDSEEQKRCFHYKNLQPLWAIDNLRKNAKILPEFAQLLP